MDDISKLQAMETTAIAEIVSDIDVYGEDLTSYEIDFIANLLDNPPEVYSTKQIAFINRLYDTKCFHC